MAYKSLTGFDASSQKLINLADPSAASDGVNLQYLQNFVAGLDIKLGVRAATTTNLTLTGPGASIDGVSMVSGDRFLVKDQSTGSQNGIYIWNGAASTATRATDADTSAKVTAGMFIPNVAEGTVNGDRAYVLTTNDAITLGTTALVFTQFGAGGTTYTAGNGLNESPAGTFNVTNTDGSLTIAADTVSVAAQLAGAGLTLTSGVLDVVGDASITVGANSLGLATGVAGTGLTLTSGVLNVVGGTGITANADNLTIDSAVVPSKYSTTVGNGSLTSITVTHNLNTRAVVWQLYDSTSFADVVCDAVRTSVNVLTLTFAVAPTAGQYTVTVMG